MFNRQFFFTSLPLTFLCTCLSITADAEAVRFDLPPIVAAQEISSSVDPGGVDRVAPLGYKLVRVQFRLSSMITTTETPQIDQWVVQCQPRSGALQILDYGPRTETGGDINGGMNIKTTEETVKSLGVSIDGSYAATLRGTAGTDLSAKQSESVQFEKHAPVEAVIASGTINRGTGVYFKLRWTNTQVLEGEKSFHMVLIVPESWRGGLIDVDVAAHASIRPFPGLETKEVTVGANHFVVAAYDQADLEARQCASELAAAEFRLRKLASTHRPDQKIRSLPALLHHVAAKFDRPDKQPEQILDLVWLDALLMGRADPFVDDQIGKQPMPVRVAVLNYHKSRKRFVAMNQSATETETPQGQLSYNNY